MYEDTDLEGFVDLKEYAACRDVAGEGRHFAALQCEQDWQH
jgi:hypothetical protein